MLHLDPERPPCPVCTLVGTLWLQVDPAVRRTIVAGYERDERAIALADERTIALARSALLALAQISLGDA